MDRSAVVVGATGQIGTAVVERLVGAGWQVRAVSRGGAREGDVPGGRRNGAYARCAWTAMRMARSDVW